MSFKVIVATVDDNYLLHNDIKSNVVVINQLITKNQTDFILDAFHTFNERGISKSRNRGIEIVDSEYCLISDDDVLLYENVEDIVLRAFKCHPDADIITFMIASDHGLFKTYKKHFFKHGYRSIMKVSSIEVAFRKSSIKRAELEFDECFGLGATFPTGEETIFLLDALRKKLNIVFIPEVIGYHPAVSSGGSFLNNPKLIVSKGAMLYRMFGYRAYFLSVIFALKKYRVSGYSFFTFLFMMFRGIKEYRK